ncbi:type II toxin-antitoxin system VapC family toxin [Rhodocista pekingensis]|uniref:Type II toxin-antitoxin system VapC family toxin n=1 Tax=Rhodocista pekingensis TaxID=201185 RepID=A0ABW2KZW9_9PROT
MRILADTHALVWLVLDDARLPPSVHQAIGDPANDFFFSVASVWEAEIKRARQKLDLPPDIWEMLEDRGFEPLSINRGHCRIAAALPDHHRDPFDRMLVAQAREEGLTLMSADRMLENYQVPLIW